MAHATDIIGYAYQADLYCPEHIVQAVAVTILAEPDPETGSWTKRPYSTEAQLSVLAHQLGIDPEDERTYDSDDFPKVIFRSSSEDGERCCVCGREIED